MQQVEFVLCWSPSQSEHHLTGSWFPIRRVHLFVGAIHELPQEVSGNAPRGLPVEPASFQGKTRLVGTSLTLPEG